MIEKLDFCVLDASHSDLLDTFTCVEDDSKFSQLKSKQRKKIREHSFNIDHFLKNESLNEQNMKLNTTHLLINNDVNELVGFVSLCNDSIQLEISERRELVYGTVPAIKIARLAISNKYHGNHLGELLVNNAVVKCLEIRNHSGVKFLTLDCYKHRLSYYKKFGFVQNNIQKYHEPDLPISLRLDIDNYLEMLESKI